MRISRQAAYHHQKSVETLRTKAQGLPLAIGYDAGIHAFVVSFVDDPTMKPVIAARFEVVSAWIDGFARSAVNVKLNTTHPLQEEDVTRAVARLVYETATRKDWHAAPSDPGLDPAWREIAVRSGLTLDEAVEGARFPLTAADYRGLRQIAGDTCFFCGFELGMQFIAGTPVVGCQHCEHARAFLKKYGVVTEGD